MNFLRRKARVTESAPIEDTQRVVHREIEIRVEREWVSVTAPKQIDVSAPASASGACEPVMLLPPLLPYPKRE
jgi:hypothetical protein